MEDNPQSPSIFHNHWWLLGGAAVGGIFVSFALFWIIWLQERRAAGDQFRLGAEKKVAAVKQSLSDQLSVLGLVKAFYAGSLEVDRNEFKTFSDSVYNEHPEIKTLAWMPRVRSEERDAFEQSAKKNGFPQFKITERNGNGYVPAAVRKQYFPILFIEPRGKYPDMLGFDLGSIPECLATMDRAGTIPGPAIAYHSIPGLEYDLEPSVYMFDEVYNEIPPSAKEVNSSRQSNGFILCSFLLRDVINNALELIQPAGADIHIFDVTVPGKTRNVISYPSRIRTTPLPFLETPPSESDAPIHYEERIKVADRVWLAYCLPTDVYFSGKTRWEPAAALLAGLLITGLVVGYMFLLIGRTARIERLVAQRSGELLASERRYRLLVDNAADAMVLHDETGCILDVNPRACEELGYSRGEMLNMNIMDIEVGFEPEEHRKGTWRRLTSDFPINLNGLSKRKDGSVFPTEVRLSCLETSGNRLIMAIVRDVTERKQAEEALHKEQRFLRHLIDLQERDRKLMAYEIHDGLAQQLTGALFKLQGLGTLQDMQDFASARKVLDEVRQLIRESTDEARRLIGGLRPPILDESGIVAAVAYLCAERRQSGGSEIEFVNQVRFNRLAAPLEVALFRIVQECLTNASKYSRSPKICVDLRQLDHRVRLTVQDWGVGFDPHQVKEDRFGLRGIRERVRLLGGTADINSTPGKGATVVVELPLAEGDIDED